MSKSATKEALKGESRNFGAFFPRTLRAPSLPPSLPPSLSSPLFLLVPLPSLPQWATREHFRVQGSQADLATSFRAENKYLKAYREQAKAGWKGGREGGREGGVAVQVCNCLAMCTTPPTPHSLPPARQNQAQGPEDPGEGEADAAEE